MSLAYVIDGYNVIKHPFFARAAARRHKGSPTAPLSRSAGGVSSRSSLLRHLQTAHLTGSSRNRVIVVFDGYPAEPGERSCCPPIEVIFSCDETADDVIKRLIEKATSPKQTIVVSDDREVKFYARSAGAAVMGVEEFIGRRPGLRPGTREGPPEAELSYTDKEKINKELREKWLK